MADLEKFRGWKRLAFGEQISILVGTYMFAFYTLVTIFGRG